MIAGLTESAERLAEELGRSRNLSELASAIHDELAPRLGNVASVLSVNRPDEGLISVLPVGAIHGETVARFSKVALAAPFPASRVIRTGQPLFLSDLDAHLPQFSMIETDFRSNGFEASCTVPLVGSRGENIASLSLIWSEPRAFDTDLQAEIMSFANLATTFLESILEVEPEQQLAQNLQRTLLRLDKLPMDAVVAAAYHSSRPPLGGDWYDAVSLHEGSVGLTVGDVAGSGLEAALAAGQLRTAAAAAALVDSRPSRVMEALDQIAARSLDASYATTIIGVLDVEGEAFEYSNAGHVPPALISPAGKVEFLNDGRRWPLGFERPRSNRAARSQFLAGSLLLLYTDGLIERRGESLELGLYRLARLLERIWWMPTSLICDRLLEHLAGHESDSDGVAVLAVRTPGTHERLFTEIVPGVVENVSKVRQRLAKWMTRLEITNDDREFFILAMSEALGNAILHGSRNDPKHLVTVEVSLDDASIIGCVRDRGGWSDQLETNEHPRGLGFRLMRGLMNAVDLKATPDMTRVVIRLDRKSA